MNVGKFIKNYEEKIIIGILVFLLIVSYRTIKEKEKIVNRYNKEYFDKYRYGFVIDDIGDDLKYLNESFKNGKVDISDEEKRLQYEMYSRYSKIRNLSVKLSEFLNAYNNNDYKPYEELKDKYYNRRTYDIIEFFSRIQYAFPIADYKSYENIKEIPIKTSSIEFLNSIYATQKLDKIIKTIEVFNREHEDDYKYLNLNNGKGFLENGYILKLIYELNEVMMDTQRELDFGEGVKLGLRNIERYDNVIPHQIKNDIVSKWPENTHFKCYYVLDTKDGIVLGLIARGEYKEYEIVSIERKDNTIDVLIEEGFGVLEDYSAYEEPKENVIDVLIEKGQCTTKNNVSTSTQHIIKGLKPGDTKNLKFNVLNTKGEKYHQMDLKDIESNN